MSDVVERLRAWEPLVASGYEVPAAAQAMSEAADEIERLRAENERLNMELQISQIAIRNHAAAQDPDSPF